MRESKSQYFPLLKLPQELQNAIAHLLDFDDKLRLSSTCAHWRSVLTPNILRSVRIAGRYHEVQAGLLGLETATASAFKSFNLVIYRRDGVSTLDNPLSHQPEVLRCPQYAVARRVLQVLEDSSIEELALDLDTQDNSTFAGVLTMPRLTFWSHDPPFPDLHMPQLHTLRLKLPEDRAEDRELFSQVLRFFLEASTSLRILQLWELPDLNARGLERAKLITSLFIGNAGVPYGEKLFFKPRTIRTILKFFSNLRDLALYGSLDSGFDISERRYLYDELEVAVRYVPSAAAEVDVSQYEEFCPSFEDTVPRGYVVGQVCLPTALQRWPFNLGRQDNRVHTSFREEEEDNYEEERWGVGKEARWDMLFEV
ncbi:hypothetical protein C8035_v008409 [Colletotrichum spinosum]|uniref:F-box domain-containing protein n=1 Tax=Colletotrichum spinosum TaxID=1347390 RepID=A0A4R8QJW2_9PEZI|nr:hypothetical protein C8035_v008409 [Colletotrichum spinosum]